MSQKVKSLFENLPKPKNEIELMLDDDDEEKIDENDINMNLIEFEKDGEDVLKEKIIKEKIDNEIKEKLKSEVVRKNFKRCFDYQRHGGSKKHLFPTRYYTAHLIHLSIFHRDEDSSFFQVPFHHESSLNPPLPALNNLPVILRQIIVLLQISFKMMLSSNF